MAGELISTENEQIQRDTIVSRILGDIRENRIILLPDFKGERGAVSDHIALLNVGIEDNSYGGKIGEYRYQFEGEEDLLHLIVVRNDQAKLSAEEAQQVTSFLYPGVPTAMMWFKPGEYSHHFYIGHDVLLEYLD